MQRKALAGMALALLLNGSALAGVMVSESEDSLFAIINGYAVYQPVTALVLLQCFL